MTTLYTIGHSNRTFEEFLALLTANEIELLVDVRQYPGSRRLPHFSKDNLAGQLPAHGIRYQHCKALGGRRKANPDSPNTGWRVEGFRAYADYLATAAFHDALDWLMSEAAQQRTAIMCAEAVWWRCHRRLIADALVVRDVTVKHILSEQPPEKHQLTDFAVVEDGELRYPAADGEG